MIPFSDGLFIIGNAKRWDFISEVYQEWDLSHKPWFLIGISMDLMGDFSG